MALPPTHPGPFSNWWPPSYWALVARKAEEWLEHQRFMAELENLGNPIIGGPPAPGPLSTLPASLIGAIDPDQLRAVARDQVAQHIKAITEQIEVLSEVRDQYQRVHESIPR